MKTLVQRLKEHIEDLVYYVTIGVLMGAALTLTVLVLMGLESWAKGFGFYGLF